MSCCGQSRPVRPVAPPKTYQTRGLDPRTGSAGTPGVPQPLPSQPAPAQAGAQPAAKPVRMPV